MGLLIYVVLLIALFLIWTVPATKVAKSFDLDELLVASMTVFAFIVLVPVLGVYMFECLMRIPFSELDGSQFCTALFLENGWQLFLIALFAPAVLYGFFEVKTKIW